MVKETKKDKEIKKLQEEVAELTTEKNKYLDIAQRAQADLVNYRKKVTSDIKESDDRAQRKIFMQVINVLDQLNMALSSKVDTKTYQGYAFGIGIDRLAMLKYGINDLRAFFETDYRWLNHFGFDPLDVPTNYRGLSK